MICVTKIQKNNVLIAVFMGAKTQEESNPLFKDYLTGIEFLSGGGKIIRLEYHKSWDWLMPVVKKIFNMGGSTGLNRALLRVDLDMIYEEVVQFITYYNNTCPCIDDGEDCVKCNPEYYEEKNK